MLFEAEVNGKKYEVKVNEVRQFWKVSIKEEDSEWVNYEISKEDYQSLDNTISFIFENSSYLVDAVGSGTEYTVYTRGAYRNVKIFNDEMLLHESLKSGSSMGDSDSLVSGMPGKIVEVFVEEGDEVTKDQPLLIMEAMKMENEMRASSDGKIKSVNVNPGDNVESGQTLISFEQ